MEDDVERLQMEIKRLENSLSEAQENDLMRQAVIPPRQMALCIKSLLKVAQRRAKGVTPSHVIRAMELVFKIHVGGKHLFTADMARQAQTKEEVNSEEARELVLELMKGNGSA